jgi:hypothetical protein
VAKQVRFHLVQVLHDKGCFGAQAASWKNQQFIVGGCGYKP